MAMFWSRVFSCSRLVRHDWRQEFKTLCFLEVIYCQKVYLDEGSERHDGGRPHLGRGIREQGLELVGRVVPGGRAPSLLVPVPARRQADHQPLPGPELSTKFRENIILIN